MVNLNVTWVHSCVPLILFLLFITSHARTDAQFKEYFHSVYFSKVDSDEFQRVIDGYPSGEYRTFLRSPEDPEMYRGRCDPGIPLWDRNPERSDAAIQEDRVDSGRLPVSRSQKTVLRTPST